VGDATDPLQVLARCVGALDGDDRPGQRRLTEAVASAVSDHHHLVAEAPTGSGKSLAYLSATAAVGARAVIATATLTLQDQLWRKDLPLVREHGGADVTGALLKGRGNYLCLAKLHGARSGDALFDERPGPDFTRDLSALSRFSSDTDTGDVADLDDSVDPASWRAMTCGPNECPGASRCDVGTDCFAEVARRRADDADIIIVNHALYAAHLAAGGRLLPEHDVVIIDEAHAFDRYATNALGADAAPGGLRQLAGRLRRAGAPASAVDPVADSATLLEQALEDLDGRIDPTTPEIASVLAVIDERISTASRAVDSDKEGVLAAQAVRLALTRLEAIRKLQSPGDDDVTWVEGGARPMLRLAPIAIGTRLAPVLFTQVPVVLLSATLGPGPRFEPLARRIGLDPGAPVASPDSDDESEESEQPGPGLAYEARRFESPFALREQAMLYVPRSLPDVRDAAWESAAHDELCGLVEAAGGRALVLCTSWRNVRSFSEMLRDRIDHQVLAQGDDTTARLVDAFVDDETSCLVATRAFWQGLDVQGAACVLVVIDRLPFTRPDDPLEQARREAVERDGGDGFREVDLPAAALALAQGAGRLIRSHADRGVVAVLDRRLAVAGYRKVLLEAMPPFKRVVDGDVAREFLRTATNPVDPTAPGEPEVA
jgi:ATP-dependent DNA helicase DinG